MFTPSVSGKYDVDYKSEDLYVYILDSDMNYVDETIIVNENVRESYPGYYVDSYYALEKEKYIIWKYLQDILIPIRFY